MDIAGGVYVEHCVAPESTRLLGSAGRAALALADVRSDLRLHSFHPEERWPDVQANLEPWGIECLLTSAPARYAFTYDFPLSRPVVNPEPPSRALTLPVAGDVVLAFACLEGHIIPSGRTVVFDPQGGAKLPVGRDAIKAGRLAIVTNADEARQWSGLTDVSAAATALIKRERADVLIIKDGPRGALVVEASGAVAAIPPFDAKRLGKIGSGDVFSAVFTHRWSSGQAAVDAAFSASGAVARFVADNRLPVTPHGPELARTPLTFAPHVMIIAAARSTSAQWIVAKSGEALDRLGAASVDICFLSDRGSSGTLQDLPDESVILLSARTQAEATDMLEKCRHPPERIVIFVDDMTERGRASVPRLTADLSLALYEVFWSPR